MSNPTDTASIAFALGKIDGQMREVIHTQNNMVQKVDGIAEKLFTAPTREDYDKLGNKMDAAIARIDALEGVNDRSDGAKSLAMRVLESKAFGVIMTALFSVVAALAALKGGIVK